MKTIALTTRSDVAATGETRDGVDRKLTEFLAALGLRVVVLPNHPDNTREILRTVRPDGIVLSGGNDVDPRRYARRGSAAALAARNISRERDETEAWAIDYCVKSRRPMVGVCRGLQMINVAFGGRLSPIPEDNATKHVAVRHRVRLLDHFPVAAYRGRSVLVNSFHNFGVRPDDLADELIATAVSPDGWVEGVRHARLPIHAVMWHPERRGAPAALDRSLFQSALVKGTR